ncbi:HmuY family protein [Epilithonimonas zeae]|uniref:HmuY family protein n=1 Tax=Epilithonimonas zeae TaxID=1416779 RepID=UPI00200E3F20|nr:HmuY family protein [Epilithonimonas zeae]UQB69639.1 HmuY family protein [Epilithonimonas zeae]
MKKLLFLLISISFIFQSCLRDNEDPVAVSPIMGKIDSADVGGASEPNQVWYDLSSGDKTLNKRTDWDLAFYSGDEFKVIINSSIMMAAGKIPNVTDINQVKESDVATLKTKVQVANFDPNNVTYIDDVKGNFPTSYTAIEEIKVVDSDNAVYLVNMGKNIYTGSIPIGSVTTGGTDRGWMKLQIVRNGSSAYKIRYANIGEATYKEYIINKNTDYNFNYFSMTDNKEVVIQPQKQKWDLCFTVFTNVIEGAGTYIYADFVTDNIVGGSASYQVTIPTGTNASDFYNNFKAADIDMSKFDHTDQRAIGANWRNPVGTNGLEVYGDRFYVVKDPEGFYFKLRFTRMTKAKKDQYGEAGERGFPQFEYKPL